jgi:hypothetical protein
MAATRRRSKRDLHVVVTESDGTVTSLLVARGGFNQIRKNPITGLGQVVTTGDNAERSDQRTPQVILTDQQGGMGEFFYKETEGLSAFTDSECDTRFPGMIVLPPLGTQLGASAALGATTAVWHVEYINETNATLLAWSNTGVLWRYDGASWTKTGLLGGGATSAVAIFNGTYFLGDPAGGLYSSTDAVTWGAIAFFAAIAIAGIAAHDNKIWVVGYAALPTVSLYQSTDGATFSLVRAEQLNPGERVVRLLEWRDRVGRAVLYVLTNQRLIQYDEDADQFLTFYAFTRRSTLATKTGWAESWQRDGNLYVVLGTAARPDNVYVFSGTTGRYGPNLRGGLPNASRVNLVHHRGGDNWLYFFGGTRASPATATAGRVMAMNDQGAFHTLALGLSTSAPVVGGGYDEGLLWAVMGNGTVYQYGVPDTTDLPLYVTSGERSYSGGGGASYNHEYAFTDGGTPNMDKQWLWVTVQCLDHTSANKVPGLAANTSVVVQYRRDVDTAWTTLGTLTSADTFPRVLPIGTPAGNGVKAKQIKVRLQLASTSSAVTPVVTSVSLAYTRQEVPRYAYTVPIDLTDRTHPLYRGKSVAGLLAAMDRWTQPGALVKLQFAGGDANTPPSTSTTIQNCTFAYSGAEDAERGPGIYQGIFADFTSPSSG